MLLTQPAFRSTASRMRFGHTSALEQVSVNVNANSVPTISRSNIQERVNHGFEQALLQKKLPPELFQHGRAVWVNEAIRFMKQLPPPENGMVTKFYMIAALERFYEQASRYSDVERNRTMSFSEVPWNHFTRPHGAYPDVDTTLAPGHAIFIHRHTGAYEVYQIDSQFQRANQSRRNLGFYGRIRNAGPSQLKQLSEQGILHLVTAGAGKDHRDVWGHNRVE